MKLTRRRERSAPVYVDTGEGVVSLVYELAVTEVRAGSGTMLRLSAPLAVHVIDDTGVQRLGVGAGERPLIVMALAFVLGPLQWLLIGPRRQQHG